MPDPIIEAAERALEDCWNNNRPTGAEPFPLSTGEALQAIVAATTPLIRAAALEEAALSQSERSILLQALRIAEEDGSLQEFATGKQVERIADKLRALKEQP